MTSILLIAALMAEDRISDVFNNQFQGYGACLIARKVEGQSERIFNPDRAVQRYSPCSTFKIPHAVFALDYGVVSPSEVFEWNGTVQPLKRWERDFTLATAIEFSAVPVFRKIALRIGEERMNKALKALNYGNKDTSGGLDRFWLTSTLKISAKEQAELMQSLVRTDWSFSKSAQKWTKAHLLVEEGTGYRIFGKTGSGFLGGGMQIGWWVGWVEAGDETWVFAGNYEGKDAMGHLMRPKVDAVLRAMGVLPAT